MKYNGFIGGSYELDSKIGDCQRTINLIPELIESGSGKGPARMMLRPGLTTFVNFGNSTPSGAIKQLIQVFGPNGEQAFALCPHSGGNYAIWQFNSSGAFWQITQNFARQAQSMATNGNQIVIACCDSGGAALYCLDLATYRLDFIDTLGDHAISQVIWHPNGYFIGLDIPDKKIYISDLMNGADWNAADTAQVFVTDTPRQIIEDHRELWIFGEKGTQVYYDTGDPHFPFAPVPGVSLQTGIVGTTANRIDNTLFWLSQNERGGYVVYRASGHTAVRISNHAIEEKIASVNPEAEDCTSWTMDYKGHAFYCLTITGLDTTLVYDAATHIWHEWGTGPIASIKPFIASNHIFAWGFHLLASTLTNKIYRLEEKVLKDDDEPLCWLRRAPHIAAEGQRIFYTRFTLDVETGIHGSVQPKVWMRYSNDGGRNFNEAQPASMGSSGETLTRVYWGPLGSARDRVFEVTGSDPVPINIIDAFLDVIPGHA